MEQEEINLIDYIKVILKRKWLILKITVGVVIAVGILSAVMPRYKVDTILEIGVTENILESPEQIVEKIKNGNYNEAVKKKLNIEKLPKIDVFNPKNTKLVIISITSSNPEQAKKILEELENLILKEHQEKFNLQKKILLENKKRIKNKISCLENEKKILEEEVNYFTNLMTTNSIYHLLLTETKEKLEKKKLEIENQYLKLNALEQKLNSYQPTRIIKAPAIPSSPAGPGLGVNIIIGLILGLFGGVFLAFVIEWWEREKKNFF